jgi:hypothetical protein
MPKRRAAARRLRVQPAVAFAAGQPLSSSSRSAFTSRQFVSGGAPASADTVMSSQRATYSVHSFQPQPADGVLLRGHFPRLVNLAATVLGAHG